jgi:hypothetical protein
MKAWYPLRAKSFPKHVKHTVFLLVMLLLNCSVIFEAGAFDEEISIIPGVGIIDEESCLFCHRYQSWSNIDDELNSSLLYIKEDLYANSPHGDLKCSECHPDITQFPHTRVKKVDCLIECHVDEPTTRQPFSHRKVAQSLSESVHGKYDQNGELKEHAEDYPDCLACHTDPLNRDLMFMDKMLPGIEEKTIARCAICHESDAFRSKFYSHFTSRMQKTRTPRELIEMCGECHGNPGIMERHGIRNAVHSFQETYHGKAVMFGDELAADCNDCHTMPGESIHSIRSKDDPQSISYPENVYISCSDIDCHPTADKKLAGFKPHVVADRAFNPIEFYVLLFFVCLTCGSFALVMFANILAMIRLLFPNFSIPEFLSKRRKESP